MSMFRIGSESKRRAPVHVPTGDLEPFLEPQRNLLYAVREMVMDAKKSFETLNKSQQKLMQAANAYFAWDFACVDESALAILQVASDFFDVGSKYLAKSGLDEVLATCDRILKEHQAIAELIKERDESHKEFEHYNGKVATMMQNPLDSIKLHRNKEKLEHAQQRAERNRKAVDVSVRTVVEHRAFHARATLHAALKCYVKTAAGWGTAAVQTSKAFDEEFRPGMSVQVVGFPSGHDLCGFIGVVKERQEDLVIITSPDGSREQGLHPVNLVALGGPDEDDDKEPEDDGDLATAAAKKAPGDADVGGDMSLAVEEPEGAIVETEPGMDPAGAAEQAKVDESAEPLDHGQQEMEPEAEVEATYSDASSEERRPPETMPPPKLRVRPCRGSSAGCEVQVGLFHTLKTDPEVEEVLVGGKPATLIEASKKQLLLRLPPGQAAGPLQVELRRRGWQRYVVVAEEAFQYFEAMSFGVCGRNVQLQTASAEMALLSVATRPTGLSNAIALTSAPVPIARRPMKRPIKQQQHEGAEASAEQDQIEGDASLERQQETEEHSVVRRYFEIEIEEVSDQRSTKTLTIGFVWPNVSETSPISDHSKSAFGRLPEEASELKRSFSIGGGRTKTFVDGKDAGAISGWRPLTEVTTGSRIGALLEEEGSNLRLTIYQEGHARCSSSTPNVWAGVDPHGLVDVNGSLKQVAIIQGALPPLDGWELADEEDDSDEDEVLKPPQERKVEPDSGSVEPSAKADEVVDAAMASLPPTAGNSLAPSASSAPSSHPLGTSPSNPPAIFTANAPPVIPAAPLPAPNAASASAAASPSGSPCNPATSWAWPSGGSPATSSAAIAGWPTGGSQHFSSGAVSASSVWPSGGAQAWPPAQSSAWPPTPAATPWQQKPTHPQNQVQQHPQPPPQAGGVGHHQRTTPFSDLSKGHSRPGQWPS
mmetsp:Transcript_94985/g.207767  ORF Transcript_94985/g.207767 Transcript_94985/m.207767 type:complete len:935 (+) Transcript_94985:188-2992(+)